MSIFARLFLLLGAVSAASMGMVSLLLWRNSNNLELRLHAVNSEVGGRAISTGTHLLEKDLEVTHLRIVREKARQLETFFADIGASVELESSLTTQFLTDSPNSENAPPLYSDIEIAKIISANPAMRTQYFAAKPYVMFHLAPGVDRKSVDESLNRLRRLGAFLPHTFHSLEGCTSVHFGSEQGFILGYPGRDRFAETYDPRARDWFRDTKKQRGLNWGVYVDRDESLILTCACPVAGKAPDETAGVAAIDVGLKDVLDELFNVGNLKVSRAMLLNERQRVLVSASFENAQVIFDKQRQINDSPLDESHDRGFARAARRFVEDPSKNAGFLWDGPDLQSSANVLVYATVKLKTIDDSAATRASSRDALNWHYVVQLPVESLIEPIHAVAGEIGGATQKISTAIQQETRKSMATILAILSAALVAALIAAYFGARSTSRPLIQMAGVARSVGEGDLSRRAIETSGGEVGELGRAVNSMIDALRQRNLLKDTFGRYVAPAVVDEVLKKGIATLGGAKRVVTIFFSDLNGFTSLAEKIAPETLIQMLNEYFDQMTKIILGSGGTLDKYIGDAILAFWGDPIAHDDDPLRACTAALAQLDALKSLSDSWTARGLPALEMSIGIQTGEVIIGNVGSELKLNYTVLGDTVNFSSRLQGVNKFFGTRILLGEAARLAAGAAIEVRELDLLTVVGKTEPVRVYELLGLAGQTPPALRDGWRAYEAALSACRSRQWEEAINHLRTARDILGDDQPSKLLEERVLGYQRNPPPDSWDGSVVLINK